MTNNNFWENWTLEQTKPVAGSPHNLFDDVNVAGSTFPRSGEKQKTTFKISFHLPYSRLFRLKSWKSVSRELFRSFFPLFSSILSAGCLLRVWREELQKTLSLCSDIITLKSKPVFCENVHSWEQTRSGINIHTSHLSFRPTVWSEMDHINFFKCFL